MDQAKRFNEILTEYLAGQGVYLQARQLMLRNEALHARMFLHAIAGEQMEIRRDMIDFHFDRAQARLFDMYFMNLVSAFEELAFRWYGENAPAPANPVADAPEANGPNAPLRPTRSLDGEAGAPGGFCSLSAFLHQVRERFSEGLRQRLEAIRLHKDFINHGGQYGRLSDISDLAEVAGALGQAIRLLCAT